MSDEEVRWSHNLPKASPPPPVARGSAANATQKRATDPGLVWI
jgi:hypothetical protein